MSCPTCRTAPVEMTLGVGNFKVKQLAADGIPQGGKMRSKLEAVVDIITNADPAKRIMIYNPAPWSRMLQPHGISSRTLPGTMRTVKKAISLHKEGES